MGLYLVPIGNDWTNQFQKTVLSPISITENLDLGAKDGRYWGTTPSESGQKQANFDSLGEGDILLFYLSGIFVGIGKCGETYRSESLAEYLWETSESSWIYSIEDFTRAYIPKQRVWDVLGMDENYWPIGFIRVAEERRKRVEEEHGSIRHALERLNDYDESQDQFNQLFEESDTEN